MDNARIQRRSERVKGSLASGALLCLLIVFAYAVALNNPFVYDDEAAIEGNTFLRQGRFAWGFLTGQSVSDHFADGQFRPLVMLSFAANYALGGISPFGYRLVNLLLHAANVLLAAVVLRRLLAAVPPFAGVRLDDRQIRWAAFFGAAMMAVHPVHAIEVLLVWKRATLLVTLFSLLAVLVLLAIRKGVLRSRSARLALPVALPALVALALASKETAVGLPALLLMIDLWLGPCGDEDGGRRRTWLRHLPSWALVMAAVLWVYPHPPVDARQHLIYVLTQAKIVWRYVWLTLAPGSLAVVYDVAPVRGIGLALVAALVGIAAVVAWAVRNARRVPLAAFAVAWAVVALAPATLLPIQLWLDEDRLYLPWILPWGAVGVGLALLCPSRRHGAPGALDTGRTRRLIAVAALGITAAAVTTMLRGSLWSEKVSLWHHARERSPGSALAQQNLCAAYNELRDKAGAADACERAYRLFPDSARSAEGFIHSLALRGRLDQASSEAAAAIQRFPASARLLRLAAHVARLGHQPVAAVEYYRRVLGAAPWDITTAIYLGRSLLDAGAIAEARRVATSIDPALLPGELDPLLTLAELLDVCGQPARACAVMVRAMRQPPDAAVIAAHDVGALISRCQLSPPPAAIVP